MNLGDLTGLVEKPFAAVSNLVNTPNSAGRYRPFYLRNLLDAVQGRTLHDAVDGTITLITGGSSGIGEAAAKKIAAAGGEVVLVARTQENLDKVADEIRSSGGTAHVYPCDLTDMDAIAAMADQVLADLGGVDMLINNAGRSIRRSLALSYDRIHDYQRTMQLNYLGAVQLILKFIPGMRERGFGQIINVSSVGVQTRAPRFGAYIASKAALDSLCDALQAEVVNDDVKFTTVHMALVRTPMISPTKMYDKFPGADPRPSRGCDHRCDRAPAPPGQLALRAIRCRRRRRQPGGDGPGAQPGLQHVQRLCRRIFEHAEGPVAHPVHHRRVDGVGDGSELPKGAGRRGRCTMIGDHTGGLVGGQRREFVVHLGGADHRRPDQRHVHRGELDVVVDDLGLQRVAQAVQRSLAGDVGAEPRRTGLHADRGDVDDLPEPAFPHARNEFKDQLYRAEVVQLHRALVVVDAVVGQRQRAPDRSPALLISMSTPPRSASAWSAIAAMASMSSGRG